jgi:neutral/alkaline ceramidase-like enzyme
MNIKKQKYLSAGYGKVNITPSAGDFCSFRLAPNKRSLGVHDNLYTHVLYLANETQSLLMISVDTVALSAPIVDKIKASITNKTGVSASQILVAATHTHNGAELLGEEPFVNNTIQVDCVVDACIKAVDAAVSEKFSARIGWGHLELPGLAKNRFQAAKNGDIARVDNRLDFLKVEDNIGNYKGIIWHFAAHPTTCMKAGYLSSADYYGAANKLISEKLGGFSTFFNGACGNINPELGKRTFERSEYYGKQIADKLIEAVPQVKTVSHGCLNSTQTEIKTPLTLKRKDLVLADDRNEIIDYFKNIENKEIPLNERKYDENWLLYQQLRTSWWQHKLVEQFGNTDHEQICLQALRILDNLILTIPGEIFIELQFDLQKAFKNNRAMIFGYANGYSGYIPDAESYKMDSYETNPSYMHRVGQYAGEQMIIQGKKLLMSFQGDEFYQT